LLQRHLCVCHPGASVRGAGREAFVRLPQWRAHVCVWTHETLSSPFSHCLSVAEPNRLGNLAPPYFPFSEGGR